MTLFDPGPVARYRRWRERRLSAFITAHAAPVRLYSCYWQPPLLVAFRVALAAAATSWVIDRAPLLGSWLQSFFEFFKLAQIFNFTFPGESFFTAGALGLAALFVGPTLIVFLLHQVEALFSAAVVNTRDRVLYYIRDRVVTRELHVIRFDDIGSATLRQWLPGRILNTGTLVIVTGSGETITIRHLKSPGMFMKQVHPG